MYVSYKMIHTEASSKCWPLFHCCTVSYLRNARDGASIIKVTWFALTTNNHTAICVLLFLPKIIPGTCPSLRKSHFPSIHSERYLSVRTFSISSSFSIQACILWQLFWKYNKTQHNKKTPNQKILILPISLMNIRHLSLLELGICLQYIRHCALNLQDTRPSIHSALVHPQSGTYPSVNTKIKRTRKIGLYSPTVGARSGGHTHKRCPGHFSILNTKIPSGKKSTSEFADILSPIKWQCMKV